MERIVMNDNQIIDIEYAFGNPINTDIEFYSTMSEDEKEATSEEESSAEESPEEAVKVEAESEEVALAIDKKSPVEKDVLGDKEDEAGKKSEDAVPPAIHMDPEEAAKMAIETRIVQASYKDMRNDLPKFRSGDKISVGYRVIEGSRSRIQTFEGVVIKISSGHGLDKTFTVRKISGGIGVERIFPFHSPNIESIKVLKQGKVRRAKLYYLRSRKGKATRIKERT